MTPSDALAIVALRCIDLTSLTGEETRADVEALCERALRPDPDDDTVPSVAAVCLYPAAVDVAASKLAGTGVRVAATAGAFPSGRASEEERAREIREAIDRGAEEVDTVLDHAAFLEGRTARVRRELEASREAAGAATLKVILETGALASPEAVRGATLLAIEAGADFVKSSTGKREPGATPEAFRAMSEAVRDVGEATGQAVGVKVAGGVRTADVATSYAEIVRETLGADWLQPSRFRIGASSLLDDLVPRVRAATASAD